jgi:DNA-binding NtrC family response regulator
MVEPKPQAAGNGFATASHVTGAAHEGIAIDGRQLEDIEREAIVRTLTRFSGHRQRTAQALGIGVRTLGLKLKKWKELRLVDAGL